MLNQGDILETLSIYIAFSFVMCKQYSLGGPTIYFNGSAYRTLEEVNTE